MTGEQIGPSVRQEWRNGATDDLPDGPWKQEPDKVQWIDEATGLDCLIVRNRMGVLCGYVGVPPGHPCHGQDYDEAPDFEVHGGLTFAAPCGEHDGPETGICHVPAPGRPADVWWFGFDCTHLFDLAPDMLRHAVEHDFQYPFTDPRNDYPRSVYRDVGYVTRECTSLARQLSERRACPHGDPTCPCQDGDVCHYEDAGNTKAASCSRADCTQPHAREAAP